MGDNEFLLRGKLAHTLFIIFIGLVFVVGAGVGSWLKPQPKQPEKTIIKEVCSQSMMELPPIHITAPVIGPGKTVIVKPPPIPVKKSEEDVKAPPPPPTSKPLTKKEFRRHQFQVAVGGAEAPKDATIKVLDLEPVIGLGYTYKFSRTFGVGAIGFTNKTFGLVLSMDF